MSSNDLLTRPNDLLCRPNDLLSRRNGLLTRPNDLCYVVGTTYYVCVKVFQKSISRQPLIRRHSYLDHMYSVRLAFLSCHRTTGSMPGD